LFLGTWSVVEFLGFALKKEKYLKKWPWLKGFSLMGFEGVTCNSRFNRNIVTSLVDKSWIEILIYSVLETNNHTYITFLNSHKTSLVFKYCKSNCLVTSSILVMCSSNRLYLDTYWCRIRNWRRFGPKYVRRWDEDSCAFTSTLKFFWNSLVRFMHTKIITVCFGRDFERWD